MKFFVYLLSASLILALLALFFIKKPNGQAWLTTQAILPNMQTMHNKVNAIKNSTIQLYDSYTIEQDSVVEHDETVKIYRWQDSNGHWSYSDKPNEKVASEEVFIDPKDVVVLPAIAAVNNAYEKANSLKNNDNISLNPLTISPNKALDLYKGATDVQKIMDGRQQQLNKVIKASSGE